VSRRVSGRRFARALFDVARAEGLDLERVQTELAGVVALVSGHETLARVLGSPAIPAARKRAIVEELLARSPVSTPLARTLLLLAERDRLVLLPELAEAYDERLLDHQQVVRAAVTAAAPLPPDRAEALRGALARATGRDVRLAVRVDPDLLGGAVARIGSTVYDGSVVTQLERLKARLETAEV
jgi:F-type H+-transporting ATPase subunit delta